MKRFTNWCAALASVCGLVLLTGAWFGAQSGAQAKADQEGKAKEAAAQARAEHMMAFKKALPTLKTPLSEAIVIAEKEMKGKAHGADVELGKDGKLKIEVRLLIGDKFEEVYVDHETKKVTVPEKKTGHEEEEEGEEGEEEDD